MRYCVNCTCINQQWATTGPAMARPARVGATAQLTNGLYITDANKWICSKQYESTGKSLHQCAGLSESLHCISYHTNNTIFLATVTKAVIEYMHLWNFTDCCKPLLLWHSLVFLLWMGNLNENLHMHTHVSSARWTAIWQSHLRDKPVPA